ncbi:hypothetical protein [Aneurinibacillus migulanus]|uniref:hypothetical protein n=1 Tax=Aneurinibacillus migulanus TaxID=47500 RepID=UPI0020A1FF13|nr:hypothetical protein [Aneurinibacillus migulanus]MCP1356800.1 hypothetical protein [Aneurinibacillus migulanus]
MKYFVKCLTHTGDIMSLTVRGESIGEVKSNLNKSYTVNKILSISNEIPIHKRDRRGGNGVVNGSLKYMKVSLG